MEKKSELLLSILQHKLDVKYNGCEVILEICSKMKDLPDHFKPVTHMTDLYFETYDYICLVRCGEDSDNYFTDYVLSGGQTKEECIRAALKPNAYLTLWK